MTGKEEKQFGGLEIIGVEVKEVIGKGGYRTSKVFQVLYEGSPAYVGKEFRFTAYSSDEREKELVKKCQRWANLQHPNIVRFIGVFKRSSSISSTKLPLLVMEKMNRSLNSLLNHRPKYNIAVDTKLSILLDVSLGIEYLHHQTPPLVHSNLSSYTILLNTEQRAKISGIEGVQIAPAVEKSQTTSTLSTLIREDVPTQSTDVFSYGSIALQTITQWQPESGSLKEYQQRHGLRSAKSIVEQYQSYLDRVTDDTKHLKGLILSCLHDDAKKRPTISEISRKIKAVAEGKSVFPIIPYSEVNGEKEKVNTLEKSLTSKNNELIFASNQEELKTHQVNEQVTIKKLVSKELEQGYQQEHISPQEIDQIDTTSNGSRQDIAGDQGDLKENKQGNNYLEDTTGNKQEKDNTGGQAEEQINALGFGKRKEENSNTPAANNKPSQADKEATGITSPPSGILPPDDQLLPKVKPTAKGKLPPADEQPTEVKPTAKGKQPPADEQPTEVKSTGKGKLPQTDEQPTEVKPTAEGKLPPADEKPTEVKPTTKGKLPPADEKPTEVKPTTKGKLPPADEKPTEVKPTTKGKQPPADEQPTEVKPTAEGKLPPADEQPTEVKPTGKGKLPPAAEQPTEVKPTGKGKLPAAAEQPTEVKPTGKGKVPPADEPLVGFHRSLPYAFSSDGLGPKVIGGAKVEQTVDIMQLVEEIELLKQNVHTQVKKLEHTEEKMLLWQESSKRNQEIMQRNLLINQKEQINRDMQQKHNKMQKQIQQKDDEIKEKAQELQYRSNRIQQTEQELKQKNFEIRQKDKTIQQKDETIQQKDKEIQQKDKEIQQKDEAIEQKDEEMQQKDEEICLIGQEIEEKDQQILQLEDDISSLQQRVSDLQKPTWIIKKHDIILSRQVVGRGGWGSVQEALYHGCKVAVKSLFQNIISNYNLQLFAREMNMAARCRHPNLLQFIGATSTIEEIPLIVTELMHTSLRKTLERNKLCSNQVVPISLGVAYGLNYLHKTTPNAILHRDVSSANVLLNPLPNNQWHPKLSDFGSTNFMIACHTINPGNATYAAPEALEGPHTPAMDVFSFGVLMFEMCSRKFPTEMPNALILRHVKWPITETKLVGLIQSCLSTELQMRSTMEQLIDELRKCE